VRAAVTRRVSRRRGFVEGGGATPKGGGALCVMLAAAECRQKLSAFLLWASMWRTSMHLIFFCCSVLVTAIAQHCLFPATHPWSSGHGGGGARDAEAGEEQVRARNKGNMTGKKEFSLRMRFVLNKNACPKWQLSPPPWQAVRAVMWFC
jgi:hypothetical protein